VQIPGEGGDIDLGTVFPTTGRRLNDKRLAGSFEKGVLQSVEAKDC